MEVNRKLNAFGAVIGAIGVFGIIFSLLILMNSIQFMKGLVDKGQMTIPAATGYQINDQDGNVEYRIVYATDEGTISEEVLVTKEEFDALASNEAAPIVRKVFMDSYGNVYSYEDLNATTDTVVRDVNMPLTLPIVGVIVSLVITIAGFVWAFKGKPNTGRDLGEIIQAKRAEEEAEEAALRAQEAENDTSASEAEDRKTE